MKNLIQTSWIAAFALLLTCFSQRSYASHYIGSDLTYENIAPGLYLVSLRLYRDCSGITLGASNSMSLSSAGCSAGRSVTLNQVGVPGFGTNLYCPSVRSLAPCNTGSSVNGTYPNYETRMYQGTVTFSTAERNCANWTMSLRLNARPNTENLVGATDLYTEAYVNLGTPPAGIINNSPVFDAANIPIPFVCKDQEANVSMSAIETDGDSLVYEMMRPLSDANTPIAYKPNNNPNTGGPSFAATFVNPATGICYGFNGNITPNCATLYSPYDPFTPATLPFQTAILPSGYCSGAPGSNAYSAYYPLPVTAGTVNWASCQTNIPVTGGFNLNQRTGVMNFTPAVYHPNTLSAAGRNKYAAVVQISEYRKINGVVTKVGHVRRDILMIVDDCKNDPPTDSIPNPAPIFGAKFSADTVLSFITCTTTRFKFVFEDSDVADLLTVNFSGASALAGGNGDSIFTHIPGLVMKRFTNALNKVEIVFYMTPDKTDVGKEYFLNLIIEDNACPRKGRQELTYIIKIDEENRAAPIAQVREQIICLGDSTPINVQFLRPDSILQAPANYVYRWGDSFDKDNSNVPHGLDPANRNNKDIIVKPTTDTRYFLAITSVLTGCLDTTSVLVRVDSVGKANATGDSTRMICRGDSALIDISIARQDSVNGQPVQYTYVWEYAPGLDSADVNNPQITVKPLVSTRYFLTQFSNKPGCPDTTSVLILVDTINAAQVSGLAPREICKGQPLGPITVSVDSPEPGVAYSYKWYLAPGVTNEQAGFNPAEDTMATINVQPLATTRYFLNLGKSNESCLDTASILVRVNESIPDLEVVAGQSLISYRGNTTLNVIGADATSSFDWSFVSGDTLLSNISPNNAATVTVNPLEATTYKVKVTNAQGCDTTLFVTVDVEPYFPNMISPDGDGKNDKLIIPNLKPNTVVRIFNRWGTLVKEYTNYNNSEAFDGKDVSAGTYFYYVREPNGKTTKTWIEIIK